MGRSNETIEPAFVGGEEAYSEAARRLVAELRPLASGLEYISESDSFVRPVALKHPRARPFRIEELAAALEAIVALRPAEWADEEMPALAERHLEIGDLDEFFQDMSDRDDDGAAWAALGRALGGGDGRRALVRLGTERFDEEHVEGEVDVLALRQTGPDEFVGLWFCSIET